MAEDQHGSPHYTGVSQYMIDRDTRVPEVCYLWTTAIQSPDHDVKPDKVRFLLVHLNRTLRLTFSTS
jgi:hypothetical protein